MQQHNNQIAKRSLAGWAFLSLLVVVFSYVFTAALALAFLVLPYFLLKFVSGNTYVILFCLGCVVVSGTLLWSMVPRKEKFAPKGPVLVPAHHPRLFAEIENIAHYLNEPMPQQLYLVADVNAWVAEVGGFAGFGARRVMGLGLPLLQATTISQFRAILTHEFGHYYTGDTQLGPWVYKAQRVMFRSLNNLSSGVKNFGRRFWVVYIAYRVAFEVIVSYWKIFSRITRKVARRQELRADELACHVAGSKALIEGLYAITRASAALGAFWQREFGPVLAAGKRAALAQGFGYFISEPTVAKSLVEHVEQEIREGKEDPYDTHPPLAIRVAAAQALPQQAEAENHSLAVSLLDDVDNLELQLLQILVPKANFAAMAPLAWDRVGAEIHVTAWRKFVQEYAFVLAGVTPATLPETLKNLKPLWSRMRDPQGMLLNITQKEHRVRALLGHAFALALMESGWEVHTLPAQFYLQRGEEQLWPGEIIGQLSSGALTSEAWIARCRTLGIEGLPFYGAAQASAAAKQ